MPTTVADTVASEKSFASGISPVDFKSSLLTDISTWYRRSRIHQTVATLSVEGLKPHSLGFSDRGQTCVTDELQVLGNFGHIHAGRPVNRVLRR